MRDSLLYRLHSYGVDKKIGELKCAIDAPCTQSLKHGDPITQPSG
jgi:hypothetical protein